MKLMFASDIHGSEYYCRMVLDQYQRECPEKLILLGDLLYHGPRNDLPKDYNPKKVTELLNQKKKQLLCVGGNCDAQVDQMVLEFPILAEYIILYLDGHMVFATHGHIYNKENLPPLKEGDILLHGHTHVQAMEWIGGIRYINPGSVSIPKENNENSYMIYENGMFQIKNMNGGIIMEG